MGSLKRETGDQSQQCHTVGWHLAIMNHDSKLAVDGQDGIALAEAIRKDLLSMLKEAVDQMIEQRTELSAPVLLSTIDKLYFRAY